MSTIAREAHEKLTSRNGFGIMSAAQIRAAGISWAEIHAMSDAGFLQYVRDIPAGGSDPNGVITIWRVMFP